MIDTAGYDNAIILPLQNNGAGGLTKLGLGALILVTNNTYQGATVVSNFVELRLYAANDQTRAEVFRLDTLPDQPALLRRFFALLAAGQVLPTQEGKELL